MQAATKHSYSSPDATMPTTAVTQPHYLMWFRRDLRIHDNTALSELCQLASQHDAKVSAMFFITPNQWLEHNMALTQVDLILRTLTELTRLLYLQFEIQLTVLVEQNFDDCTKKLVDYCQKQGIQQVFANQEYELNEIQRDQNIGNQLNALNINFKLFHDQCILPPNAVLTQDGQMYKVFTPFYKRWLQQLELNKPSLAHIEPTVQLSNKQQATQQTLNKLLNKLEDTTQPILKSYQQSWLNKILGSNLDSQKQFDSSHNIDSQQLLANCKSEFPAGEVNTCHRLDQFINQDILSYDVARDAPAANQTSGLSPYLAIGAISPRLCYLQAYKALNSASNTINIGNKGSDSDKTNHSTDILRWISELAWRDFYRHQLVAKPNLIKHQAFYPSIDAKVAWSYNTSEFNHWCFGQTGFPIVDAAMRCLTATGFMHNRLRMIVAMFLTKDLLIDWRLGEKYFMQMLIDGDFASNNGGWQWSASTGTDAAPYFRIMNPFSQSKTHDKDAIFIKTWLPELANVPANILHDEAKLRKYLTENPNTDYPMPIVEHKQARLRAIEQFKQS